MMTTKNKYFAIELSTNTVSLKNWNKLKNNNKFHNAVNEFVKPIEKEILSKLESLNITIVDIQEGLQVKQPIFIAKLYIDKTNPNAIIPPPMRNKVKEVINQVLEDNNINDYFVSLTGNVVIWSIYNIDKIV